MKREEKFETLKIRVSTMIRIMLILLLRSRLESNFSFENIKKKKKKKTRNNHNVADIYIALWIRKFGILWNQYRNKNLFPNFCFPRILKIFISKLINFYWFSRLFFTIIYFINESSKLLTLIFFHVLCQISIF